MAYDCAQYTAKNIQTLIPYEPGKSIASLKQERNLEEVIKLASNENPWGCSPAVKQALATLSDEAISRYPSAMHHPLHKRLCEAHHLSQDALLLSNGSDALFTLLMTTFILHTKRHALTHDYAFSAYHCQANALGVPLKSVPVEPNFSVNVDTLLEAVTEETGLIFIANPNNPTGLSVPKTALKRLLSKLPTSCLLILDEAYIEYAEQEDTLLWLKDYPNLVLLRTFSKAYGLAGLRIGYAMAHENVIALLRRVQLPFIVNEAAMAAALAAFEDQDFVKKSVATVQTQKPMLYTAYKKLGFTPLPSDANFITVHCHQNALPLYEKLLQKGIIVRPLHAYGLEEYLRITIGTPYQNERLLQCL